MALAACRGTRIRSAQRALIQGTAFAYQGWLRTRDGAANGSYEITFARRASTNTGQLGSRLTDRNLVGAN